MFDFFKGINTKNSSMSVQCNAKGVCEMRHTTLCENCKHNCGVEKNKNYFEKR